MFVSQRYVIVASNESPDAKRIGKKAYRILDLKTLEFHLGTFFYHPANLVMEMNNSKSWVTLEYGDEK